MIWIVDYYEFVRNLYFNVQARHNFSKTEGAAQKLGGQNIKKYLIFNFLVWNLKKNR